MHSGKEVAGGFVVACRNRAKLLEFGEEVLDQVPCLVEIAVVIAERSAVGPWRDHGGFARRRQRFKHPLVGIERLVGDQCLGLHLRQKLIGTDQIMRFAAAQVQADRIAERVNEGVDLGTQTTARAPDRLVLAGFFWAPALC